MARHAGAGPAGGGAIPGTFIIETADCRKAFEDLKARAVTFEGSGMVEQPGSRLPVR